MAASYPHTSEIKPFGLHLRAQANSDSMLGIFGVFRQP